MDDRHFGCLHHKIPKKDHWFSRLLHLILSLSISNPYLTKFHYFADNSQEEMKHQMKGGTQAQQGMTLQIILLSL
jgi:hypothetical protein